MYTNQVLLYLLLIYGNSMRTFQSNMLHIKCRNTVYPDKEEKLVRFPVPLYRVSWDSLYPGYNPIMYTSKSVIGQPWADPDINAPGFKPIWNSIDVNISRISFCGKYKIENGYPLNPEGRTGLMGRGLLGRWGPNHAADPIVTRWKKIGDDFVFHKRTALPVIQFVAIKRSDSGEWAIPGGMVDPGEIVSTTLKREFMEEAMNVIGKSEEEVTQIKKEIDGIFKLGKEVFRGYVDDPRNTDNAWIETIATVFHDVKGTNVGKLILHAGDDAVGVKWVDLDRDLKFYANHLSILEEVSKILKSHW